MLKKMVLVSLVTFAPLFAKLDDLEEVNFPLNSAVVVDAFPGLDLLAEVMKKYPDLTLEVVGFTDYLGTNEYNKTLSMKRAEAVKAYLLQQGVSASQVTTKGLGENNFKAENESREGRFQNRRVELLLYEQLDGKTTKVSYERLKNNNITKYPTGVAVANDHDQIMQKLSELESNQKAIQEAIAAHKQAMMQAPVAPAADGKTEKDSWKTSHLSQSINFSPYGSVAFDLGNDDYDDFNGRVRGFYFRPLNENIALQLQGEWYHSDMMKEGGLDAAMVFQRKFFKMGGALSYKMVTQDGWDSALLAQGSVVMNFQFPKGHFGLFATTGFDDGDIVLTEQVNLIYTRETYLQVVDQVGLNFGFLIGKKVAVDGSYAKLDTDLGADTSADLSIEFLAHEKFSFYLQGNMNRNIITNDDNMRYALGVRLGAWQQPRYEDSETVSPINIPGIKYEVATRMIRTGNTAPSADAGMSQVNVPEGTVTLDASASSDREGDALTYKWNQVSGSVVTLSAPDQAVTTFEGKAGDAYTFMVTVTDSFGLSGSDLVQVVMEDVEVVIPMPVIEFFTATPDTIDEGGLSNLNWSTAYATDVTIAELGQVNTSGSIVLSPSETTIYTLTATSDQGTVSETVLITVIPIIIPDPPDPPPPNNTPVAVAGPDQMRFSEGTVQLDGTGSFDPDGDTLSYRWIIISATNPPQLSGSDTATPTFNAVNGSSYIFRLIVSDGRGGISTDDVLVKIL